MVENTPTHQHTQQIERDNRDQTLNHSLSNEKQREHSLTEFAENVKKGRKIIDSLASGYCVQIAPINAMIEPD
jgi:hypothetical protein